MPLLHLFNRSLKYEQFSPNLPSCNNIDSSNFISFFNITAYILVPGSSELISDLT